MRASEAQVPQLVSARGDLLRSGWAFDAAIEPTYEPRRWLSLSRKITKLARFPLWQFLASLFNFCQSSIAGCSAPWGGHHTAGGCEGRDHKIPKNGERDQGSHRFRRCAFSEYVPEEQGCQVQRRFQDFCLSYSAELT